MKKGVSFALLALAATVTCAFGADRLFQLAGCSGICQVSKPGSNVFQEAVKGKAYPYGTIVRTVKDGTASIQLTGDDTVTLASDTCVTALLEGDGDAAKLVVDLEYGKVTVFTIAEDGARLSLRTPIADCLEMHGRSDIALLTPTEKNDAYSLSVQAAAGGSVTISAPQIKVPDLKAGYSVKLITSRDRSYTRILNTLGDYPVLIDNGGAEPVSISTSTRSAIRIWREFAPVGHREIVSVFATGPDGKGRERFAFAVGQPLVAAAVAQQDWTEEADSSNDDGTTEEEGGIDFDSAFGDDGAGDSTETSADDLFSSDGDDLW